MTGVRMDWDAWARKTERALDMEGGGDWKGLFAPAATFGDPHTPSTKDLRGVARHTRKIFPDWRLEISTFRGGDRWAVFEWVGRGTFTKADTPRSGTPIEIHRATIVEVNENGLVTSWRDYLDRKEPEEQILAAIKNAKKGAGE